MIALVFFIVFLVIAALVFFASERNSAVDDWLRGDSEVDAVRALDEVQRAFGLAWEASAARGGFEALGEVEGSVVRVVVGDGEVCVEWSGGLGVEGAEVAWVDAEGEPPRWRAETSGERVQVGDAGFDRRFVVRGGASPERVLGALSVSGREALLALAPARASVTEGELSVVWAQGAWVEDPCMFMRRAQVAAQALRRARAEGEGEEAQRAVEQAVAVG